jgi:anti-sigma factor RsiW
MRPVANRPDRNRAIEGLLREAGTLPGASSEGPCVTTEQLAAWVDGGLAPAEAGRVEAHLASCASCQALLSAFAATEPGVEAARARRLTRVLWPFAAAAVLVLGVWLADTRREPPLMSSPAERQLARLEEPQAPNAAPGVAPSTSGAAPPPPGARATLEADRGETSPDLARRARASAAVAPRPAAGLPASAAAPPAPGPGAANVAAENEPRADRSEAERLAQREESLAGSARLASAQAKAVDVTRLPLVSPDGASRWRVAGSSLQVSGDGGSTWEPAAGVSPADLAGVTSGASPARGVSWLVGRNGLVLVTADGRRFTRATPPAAAQLTSVEAVDAFTAEVRDADGRGWRTSDAGRSWTPLR